jgi:hypothetical protein
MRVTDSMWWGRRIFKGVAKTGACVDLAILQNFSLPESFSRGLHVYWLTHVYSTWSLEFWNSEAETGLWSLGSSKIWSISPTWQKPWVYNLTISHSSISPHPPTPAPLDRRILPSLSESHHFLLSLWYPCLVSVAIYHQASTFFFSETLGQLIFATCVSLNRQPSSAWHSLILKRLHLGTVLLNSLGLSKLSSFS